MMEKPKQGRLLVALLTIMLVLLGLQINCAQTSSRAKSQTACTFPDFKSGDEVWVSVNYAGVYTTKFKLLTCEDNWIGVELGEDAFRYGAGTKMKVNVEHIAAVRWHAE